MALTLADLFASPDHYLQSFAGGAALFVPMDRAAYHRSIFLDGRIAPAAEGEMAVPVAALGRAPAAAATGWIFHIAHCGSTLLARGLDDPAANLVLREPLALRQVALAPDDTRLAIVLAMLGKRYDSARPTIVKANVPVNFLLPRLAAADGQARAILLYCGLRDWLLAILRSDEHRGWLGRVTTQLVPWLGDLAAASDARRAATLWLAQMRAFADALARLPHARTLDAETFFATPATILPAAARLLGVPMTDAQAQAIVSGPLFATYSKNPGMAFDNSTRLTRRAALEATLADEIAEAERHVAGQAEAAMAAIRGAALVAG